MSESQLKKAAEITSNIESGGPFRPTHDDLLELYKYYKQATEGDAHGDRPAAFDLKGKHKRSAWESVRGMSKEDSQKAYVDKVIEIFMREGGGQTYIDQINAA